MASAIAEAGEKTTNAMLGTGEKAVNAKFESGGNMLDTVAKLARNEHGGISLRTIGKGALHSLPIVGAAIDLHEVATSDKRLETGLEKAGGWGGALVGAELFGALGTAIEPGPGTLILGGIGGVIGYYHGEKAVRENIDVIKGIVTGEGDQPPVVTYPDGSRWTTYWVSEMGTKMFTPVRENHIDHGHHTENGITYKIVHAKELYPDVDNLQVARIYTNSSGEKCTTYWDPETGLVDAPLQAHPSIGYHTENGITYDIVHASDLYPEVDKRKFADIYTNEAGEKLTVYWNPDKGLVEASVQEHPYHGYHTENGITYEVAYVEDSAELEEVVVTASRDGLQKGKQNAQDVQQEVNSAEKAALNSGQTLAFNPAAQFGGPLPGGSKPVAGENNANIAGGQQPDSIGARPGLHNIILRMRNLEQEQEKLKEELDQYKGEALTREKTEQLAKSSYVNGEDEQIVQQMKVLQAERAQLQQNETWNNEFGRENRFDSLFWRYVPDWMKSDELKAYEHNTKVIEQKKQDFNQRESEIAAKTEKLQERLQTPEARAAIEEKVRQYLEQDAERLTKLEHIDTKLGEVQKEMINNIQQATGVPVKQGSQSPEQSMVTWQRITDIMNVEPRPKISGAEKLLIGEAREYRIQAKAIIEREGYWPGQAADAEIAGNMYMKGYSKERVSLAFMDASPETVNNTINQNIQYGRDIAAQAFTSNIQHNMHSPGMSL